MYVENTGFVNHVLNEIIKKVFSVYDILYLDLFKNILIDVYILTCECPFWLLSYFN